MKLSQYINKNLKTFRYDNKHLKTNGLLDKEKFINNPGWMNSKNTNFLIYQMGKVGSSSIRRTLDKFSINNFHTHIGTEAEFIINNCNSKIVLITGLREPLNRTISAFFENINRKGTDAFISENKKYIKSLSAKQIISHYFEKQDLLIDVAFGFYANLQNHTGISFPQTFKNEGYSFFRNGEIECCVYKLEYFKLFEENFIEKYLNSYKSNLYNGFSEKNIGTNKWYSEIYTEFKKEFFITKTEYLNKYGSIDYVEKFYNKNDLLKHVSNLLK